VVLYFPFLVIVSPLRNSGPCNSFDYLGHSKNVDDDDDDDDDDVRQCASSFVIDASAHRKSRYTDQGPICHEDYWGAQETPRLDRGLNFLRG